jgi:hypothetical protein
MHSSLQRELRLLSGLAGPSQAAVAYSGTFKSGESCDGSPSFLYYVVAADNTGVEQRFAIWKENGSTGIVAASGYRHVIEHDRRTVERELLVVFQVRQIRIELH